MTEEKNTQANEQPAGGQDITAVQQVKKSASSGKAIYTAEDYRSFQVKLIMRLSMVLCFFMLLGNVVFALSLMQIAGSVRVDSVVLTKQNSSPKMVGVEPVLPDMNNLDTLNEVMIKKYITLRHNIISDAGVMESRWGLGGLVHLLSTGNVYMDFYKNKAAFSSRMLDIKNGAQIPMEVEFLDIKKLASNLWSVDFDTIEFDDTTGLITRKHWVASLRAQNIPEEAMYYNFLINPLGFIVTEYNYAQKVAK